VGRGCTSRRGSSCDLGLASSHRLARLFLFVVEEHEDLVLGLHLAQRRASRAEEEADGGLWHIEGGDVLSLLEVVKVDLHGAAVALLQSDLDRERRKLS